MFVTVKSLTYLIDKDICEEVIRKVCDLVNGYGYSEDDIETREGRVNR